MEFSYPRAGAGFDGTPAAGVVFSPGGAQQPPPIDGSFPPMMMPVTSRALVHAAILVTLAFVGVAAFPVQAFAQSSPSAAPAGADVIVIIPDSLHDAPRTLSELLRERVPSVSVNRASGGLGASAFVSLRDASAVRGDDPLVVIDGVRQVSYRAAMDTLSRRAPSILDDIMLDDVARVEVLTGPAAAADYGYDGQRGVIVVTTRPPGHGHPSFRASITTSAADDNASFTRNLARVSGSGSACPYYYEAAGFCTATATTSYTPLLDRSPFRAAQQARVHLGASGGLGALGYAASLGYERGIGTMEADAADRTVASLHLAMPVASAVRVSLVSSATERGITLPIDGYGSVIASGLGGGPLDCSPSTPCGIDSASGGYRTAPLSWLAPRGPRRRIGHLGQALEVAVDATSRLALRTTVSADLYRNQGAARDSAQPGYSPGLSLSTVKERNWRVDAGEEGRLTAGFAGGTAVTRLAFRGHFERSSDNSRYYAVTWYPGSLPDGLYQMSTTSLWQLRNRYETSLDQRLAWGDRASLGVGAIRTAWSGRSNAPDLPSTFDGHADAMYEVVPAGSSSGRLTSLRVRSAWGRTSGYDGRMFIDMRGIPPQLWPTLGYGDIYQFGGYGYGPVPVPKHQPDRSAEFEGGFDATFAPGSARLSLTGFSRHESVRHDFVSALATGDVNGAIGRRVTGGELVAEATPIDVASARLHLRGQLAVSHDRVSGVKSALLFFPQGYGVAWTVANGQSWNAMSVQPHTWSDANGSGRIEASEITLGTTNEPAGRTRPSSIASLASDLSIARSFTVTAVLDHVGGFNVFDMRSFYQCARNVCPALNDPNASLSDQANAVAASRSQMGDGFVVPGDATRLREVSVGWHSSRAAAALQASSLELTLAAYDIASWTRSKGVHPETDVPPPGNRSVFAWSVVQPIPRTFALRVALGY